MSEFDLVIIGGGPAGYVAAIRAGQLGMKTALVEKEKLGGMCLNWGCIPSKTLMESAKLYDRVIHAKSYGIEGTDKGAVTFNWTNAVGRKDRIVMRLVKGVEFLMKKNKIEVISGEAAVKPGGLVQIGDTELRAKNILVATGSRPDTESLTAVEASMVIGIRDLYDAKDIPDKILINGSSAYACETAFMLRLLGKRITLVAPETVLMPFLDHSPSEFIAARFNRMGIKTLLGQMISGQSSEGIQIGESIVDCDAVVNCSNRTAVLPPAVDLAIDTTPDGFLAVDEHLQTNIAGLYAAGDVTGQITAQAGSAQGLAAVNHMAGIAELIDYDRIPTNIYMSPEIASVGLTERQLEESGEPYAKGTFSLSANGKAMAEGNTDGFVKVLADKKYGEVMGVHIVAPNATDMISEAVAIMQLEGTLEDIGRIVHAHPTVSETFVEAALSAMETPRHS